MPYIINDLDSYDEKTSSDSPITGILENLSGILQNLTGILENLSVL